mgnify:CR=1 FL=1
MLRYAKHNQMEQHQNIRLTVHVQPLDTVTNLNNITEEQELLEKLFTTLQWFKDKKLFPLPAIQLIGKEACEFLQNLSNERKISHYNSYIKKFKILER